MLNIPNPDTLPSAASLKYWCQALGCSPKTIRTLEKQGMKVYRPNIRSTIIKKKDLLAYLFRS